MQALEGLHLWMSIFVQNLLLNMSVHLHALVILLSVRPIANFVVYVSTRGRRAVWYML
jgi:hypothetical protein